MRNSELITGKDIERNFERNFSFQKYRELSTYPDYKKLFNPRGFGILLWGSHDEVVFYKNDFRKIIRYFTTIGLSKNQLLYLLENLRLTFSKTIFPYQQEIENDQVLDRCLDHISLKCDKLTNQLNTDIYRQCHLFDFRLIKRNLELIPGLQDRIKYLVNIKADYCQYNYANDRSPQAFSGNSFEDDLNRHLESLEYEKYRMPSLHPDLIIPTPSAVKSPEYMANYISERICAMDATQWRYVFKNEKDFKFLVNLMVRFFSRQPIDLNFEIELQLNCKTRLCPVLHTIYAEFDATPIIKNKVFLSILKNLSVFKRDSFLKIRNDISRSWDVI